MSPMWIKFISALVMNSLVIVVAKKLFNSNMKLLSLKNVIWILVTASPILFFYFDDYDFTTVLMLFLLVLAVKNIFNKEITKAFIISLYTMLFSILPDFICTTIVINFINFDLISSNAYIRIISSLIIAVATYYLFEIPIVKRFVNLSLEQMNKPRKRKMMFVGIITFSAICITYSIITSFSLPTEEYMVSNIVAIIFIVIMIIFVIEVIRYDKLEIKNRILFDCMNNIEIYQEEQDLKIHEYKNQLSKITSVTKDKKVLRIVEDILQIDLNEDHYILGQLQYIPKGELKSLIYYKLLVANKQEIKPLVETSDKLVEKDFAIINEHSKEITQLIGIYFDNAIEAAMKSKKKILSFEIYKVKGDLNIVISNTYKESVDLSKISEKGVSTKGAGRGKGLYFAKKIVNNSKFLSSDNKLLGDLYVQKLTMKKDFN